MARGNLFIISAPSGAGKTSLVKALLENVPGVTVSISHTTRPPRSGEENGVHYHFCDRDAFIKHRNAGEFVEHAEVFGNFYGTSAKALEDQLNDGLDVILEIDWQGAQQVRRKFSDTISVFIFPPSREILLNRLRDRGQDNEAVIAQRSAEATIEMSHYQEFDYLVVNDHFDTALADLQSIFYANRLTQVYQAKRLDRLIDHLLAK